ncbi:MAG: glycosyltransferase family 39 protein, partial [Anaerolineae bacterium]|nr:glycosyltransferase family 39 protein [Anaerolineae bacterium]
MKGVRQTTFILVLLVAIFAWAALTYPGYFELEHGFRPLFNLTDLAEHWPAVGWVPTTGQPYDLLRGEGALPYWLALIPRALAGSSATAMRWFFIATVLAGTMGMYAWARRTLGAWPALIAAAVYALWPAGLATVYVRGAPAEATFLAIMPWTLWAVARASRTRADENLTPDLAPRRTGADVASPSLAGKGVGGSGAIFRAVPQAAAGATAHEKALLTPQFWGEPDFPQFWGEPDSPQSWGGGG